MAVRLFFIFTFFWSLAYFQLYLWNSIALGVGLYLVWRLVRKRLEVQPVDLVEKGVIRRGQTLYEQTERGVVNNFPHVIAFGILVFCLLGSRNEVYHLDSGTYFLQLAVVYFLACASCQACSDN